MYINPYLTTLYLNYGLHFIERIVYFNKNLLFVCENAVIFSLNENFYGFQRIFPHLKIYKIYEKSKNKFAFKYIFSFFFFVHFVKAYISMYAVWKYRMWQHCSSNVDNIVYFEYCIKLCDEWVNH